jgi:2-hydroxychromene-2-carboxylate isomerase
MTSAAPAPIELVFDYLSPYAYIAWTQIHALAARHGRAVKPVPVLFAALLDAHGTKGPAEVPAKRVWVWKDVARTAALLGLPLSPPPSHPFNPLLGLRVSSLDLREDRRRALIDGLYRATWGGGPGITDPEVVRQIADEAGVDGAWAVEQAGTPAIKERLKAQTARALAAGAFGVPTMLVAGPEGEELFWGYDSFRFLELFLEGKDPLDRGTLARFKDLPATSVRPGAGSR